MENYGLEKPLIETGDSWFCIALRRKPQDLAIERQRAARTTTPSAVRAGEGVTSVLNHVRLHPGLRTPAISRGLNVPIKTIERWIKQLREQGLVEFRGSPKKGGYHALPTDAQIDRK